MPSTHSGIKRMTQKKIYKKCLFFLSFCVSLQQLYKIKKIQNEKDSTNNNRTYIYYSDY